MSMKPTPARLAASHRADAESFTLANDPPAHRPAEFDNHDRDRQRELFIGRIDLRGQTYLIDETNVDGEHHVA
jgi:hypothetical protein